MFGPGRGRSVRGRFYDKLYKGFDIEFKSDNFLRRPRLQEEVDRMLGQLDKDILFRNAGLAKPHWHFLNDPSGIPEMEPVLDKLKNNGIPWSFGNKVPF